jgi:hypothetical protein
MIVQRPSAMHARDREIAAMPIARDETSSRAFIAAGLLFWTVFFCAVLGWVS